MGYQTGLAKALASRGLEVEVLDGWKTRGSSVFNPKGAVAHWTAGPRTGDRPSLKIVRDGRADLPGPLANVFLTRAGVAIVVAAGRANHAGAGGWKGLSQNSQVFGTEAESSGNGDWTDAQRWAYPRINAAYCDLGGFNADMVCGHNEWAPNRKIDIHDWTMTRMRAQVTALLTTQKDTDMPLTKDDLAAIEKLIVAKTGPSVWGHGFQATEYDGQTIPAQTAGQRVTGTRKVAAQVNRRAQETLILVRGYESALKALAESKGVDGDAIVKAVKDATDAGVKDALGDFKLTLSPDDQEA